MLASNIADDRVGLMGLKLADMVVLKDSHWDVVVGFEKANWN